MKIGLFEIVKDDQHYFGVPNILTIARLLFIPVIVYFLKLNTNTGNIIALFAMILSGLTDYFDGYFARKLNQRSQLGRMLDPLVDKINVAVIMLALAAYKGLPYIFAFFVIGRDITILIAGIYVISKKRIVVESNLLGKITLSSFLAVTFCYTANLYPLNIITMWISIILIPSSLITYYFLHQELIPKRGKKAPKNSKLVTEK